VGEWGGAVLGWPSVKTRVRGEASRGLSLGKGLVLLSGGEELGDKKLFRTSFKHV